MALANKNRMMLHTLKTKSDTQRGLSGGEKRNVSHPQNQTPNATWP